MTFLRRQGATLLPDEPSPLTGGSVEEIAQISRGEILERWTQWAGLDVRADLDLDGIDRLSLRRCVETGLEYTAPDADFTRSLLHGTLRAIEREVYETPWEHTWALRELEGSRRLLMVENGDDPTLRLARRRGFNAQGTSSSAAMTRAAQMAGLPVEHLTIDECASIYRDTFHAVTAFDQLDRVPHPGHTLERLLQLVRPGGHLVVSVGYADSDVDRVDDLILLPPLTSSRWTEDTFRQLPEHFPVELDALAAGQIGDESTGVHRSRFQSQFDLTDALSQRFPDAPARALARLALRRFASGQRLYARLRRL